MGAERFDLAYETPHRSTHRWTYHCTDKARSYGGRNLKGVDYKRGARIYKSGLVSPHMK